MAKRTALIGDQGGSLYLYGLSYLQSLLLIPRVSFENIYIIYIYFILSAIFWCDFTNLFIFILFFKSSSDTKYPNKSLETIDVNNLNAIDIVTFARQALEQDDLEQVTSQKQKILFFSILRNFTIFFCYF